MRTWLVHFFKAKSERAGVCLGEERKNKTGRKRLRCQVEGDWTLPCFLTCSCIFHMENEHTPLWGQGAGTQQLPGEQPSLLSYPQCNSRGTCSGAQPWAPLGPQRDHCSLPSDIILLPGRVKRDLSLGGAWPEENCLSCTPWTSDIMPALGCNWKPGYLAEDSGWAVAGEGGGATWLN